ncbi:MAG TPA: GSU2403 family nucleotidyltransferase fold protein [Devosia sp.]|nr:GSU2403 family nucleotidyltransferase fold protein [Devosia sp.]
MKELDLVYRTMYAELLQRSLDGAFHADFDGAKGNFVTVPVKGRDFWYFDEKTDAGTKRRYVGPASDPEIQRRVTEFKAIKDDIRARSKLVSTLVREARLLPPERVTGDVVAALAQAGLFRLRGVLVGTAAYQVYSGYLGVRLPSAAMQTGDTDLAQSHALSSSVGDTIPDMLGVLKAVDPTFRAVPHRQDTARTTKYRNSSRYEVEFLTPNTGSADNDDRASPMPALGGTSAQPLRFLDYLILEPVHAVLLHKTGIPVLVPAPERFAVHKLIVAARRQAAGISAGKRDKDIAQAGSLIEALEQLRLGSALAAAFSEAWQRGPGWRDALRLGLGYLPDASRHRLGVMLERGLADMGEDSAAYAELLGPRP